MDNATAQTFETSLAMQLLTMFAYIARGGYVSRRKQDFIAAYFSTLYPQDIAHFFSSRFEELQKPDSELDETYFIQFLNYRLSYQEKVFCLLTLYEFILSDGPEPAEIDKARDLATAIGVLQPDIAFIEQDYGVAESDPATLAQANILALRITGDMETADVFLPYPGLDLVIYKIHNLYGITKKNELYKIMAEGQVLQRSFSSRITMHSRIMIDNYNLRYQDLIIYFRNKVYKLDAKLYIAQDDLELTLSHELSKNSLAEILVNGSHLHLRTLDQDAVVAHNRTRVSEQTYVNLNDEVYVNGFRLDLREVFYYLSARRNIALDATRNIWTVSNDIKADVFIHDTLAEQWSSTLTRKAGKFFIDTGNAPYQIFLNGQSISGRRELDNEDILFLHDSFLELDLSGPLLKKSVFSFRKLTADQLSHSFENGAPGIDDISFEIQYGELVGIMGPSGCGKTTLLNILSGLTAPTKGKVLVDEYNLHRNYPVLKDYLGYVPQDDLLLANLTVYENLYYHARLRFPDKKKEELRARIDMVLENIRLVEKRNTRVGQATDKTLSGGERKRLNIGLELLSNAEMYFLDEPTSGLSSKDSEKIMEILADLAMSGKIVVVVIHQPGSKLFKMFNKLILLDNGGRLAYYGTAYSALEYFKRHMEMNLPADQVEVECPHCKTVQPNILLDSLEDSLKDIDGALLGERKYSPLYWKRQYRRKVVSAWFSNIKLPTRESLPPRRVVSFGERLNQFVTLFSRNYANKVRDRSNLLITFLEAPFLGAACGFILKYSPAGDYTLYTNELFRTFLFIAVIVSAFLGMTNSVDEIISDTALFLRERMLNITHRGYLAAKILMLMLFSLVQNILFVAMGFLVLEVKELFVDYVLYLTLLSFTGVSMGLCISAAPKLSSKAALNFVPLLLIPQIILGGALIEYEKMNINLTFYENNPIPEICQFMPSRWAYEGLMVLQESKNSYDSKHTEMMHELREVKQNRKTIIDSFGDAYYLKKEKSLSEALEIFREKYKYQYGNKNIHDAVIVGETRYQELLKQGQENGWTKLPGKGLTYPMFVRTKHIPKTDRAISTITYNAGVLLLTSLLVNMLTLIMLKYRDKLLHWAHKANAALHRLGQKIT